MAQTVKMVLVDDLDGSPADTTVQFGLDGRHYEIDLTTVHAKELREQLKSFVRKARAVEAPAPREEARQIRQWARANGYEVPARGRIHRDIIEAYYQSTS